MEKVVQHLKALADETRLKLLTLLAERPCCVCELAEVLNMSQPTITRHLQKLLDAGFLKTKKCENFQIYWIEPRGTKLKQLLDMVLSIVKEEMEIEALLETLKRSRRREEVLKKCYEGASYGLEKRS